MPWGAKYVAIWCGEQRCLFSRPPQAKGRRYRAASASPALGSREARPGPPPPKPRPAGGRSSSPLVGCGGSGRGRRRSLGPARAPRKSRSGVPAAGGAGGASGRVGGSPPRGRGERRGSLRGGFRPGRGWRLLPAPFRFQRVPLGARGPRQPAVPSAAVPFMRVQLCPPSPRHQGEGPVDRG